MLESEKKYRPIIDRSRDLIWMYDMDLNLIYVSPSVEKIRGYKPEEEMQQTLDGVLSADSLERVHKIYGRINKRIRKGESCPDKQEIEVETWHKDGRKVRLKSMIFCLKDSSGRPLPMVGISRDVTDCKREALGAQGAQKYHRNCSDNALDEKICQIQKAEATGRLAGGVAHDLNNMLTPIIGYSAMLINELEQSPEQLEAVEEIMQAGIRARDLVRQLLAFSRKQTLEYKPMDINKTLAGFKNLLRRTIREDIKIELLPCADVQTVMADIGQIEQVIMNLAVNAADAMPGGGKLTFETAMIYLDEAYADNHPETQTGHYVMLAVSDTGCGMDKETLKNIFEPFFSTKGEQGTGLGLATVYGIVKQHGGSIWVYSEPHKGTVFKVYLPVSENQVIENTAEESQGGQLKGSETILIVEDNEKVCRLACEGLKKKGYRVISANSGREALRILASHDDTVQLLLTDVIMPGINGKKLFAKLSKKYAQIKVLYMSGYTGSVIAHHGILNEGIQFIQKPFTIQGLAKKVREVLDQG